MQGICLPFAQSSNCKLHNVNCIYQDLPGYFGVMNYSENLSGLRQQKFVFHSGACPLKVIWGSTVCLSLCLPGDFHFHIAVIAKAVIENVTNPNGSLGFYLKLLLKNEPVSK